MTAIRIAISRHPVAAFLGIAYAFTWILTFASSISLAFALLALFGPAVAAIIVTRVDGTWPDLRARITGWRRPARIYALAVGIPFGVALAARIGLVASGTPVDGFGAISAIEAVIFILVIGEEIGWRGFLQPRLRARQGLAVAGIATGVVWVLWHLPIYLAPDQGLDAFVRFTWWVIPLSVAMGVVAEKARFSVIVATVMHGSANIATPILLPGVDRAWWLVVTGALYAVVAIALVMAARSQGQSSTLPATPAGSIGAPSAIE
jgi:membrane protease YdiL (CAAX protease family)